MCNYRALIKGVLRSVGAGGAASKGKFAGKTGSAREPAPIESRLRPGADTITQKNISRSNIQTLLFYYFGYIN